MSYFFVAGAPEVAGGDVDDAVGEAERLHEAFLDVEDPLVLRRRHLRRAEHEHLDLVELVDPEHAARVLPRRSRFAPEAGGVARIATWKRPGLQDLPHVERRERHLRGPRQIQLVPLDAIDVDLFSREKARAVHRLLAHEHGRQHGHEAFRRQPVEGEAVERQLEQCDGAGPVSEAGAREPGTALHVDPALAADQIHVVARLEVELRRLADPANLLRVVVGLAVRCALVRRVRHAFQELTALRLGLGQFRLEALKLAPSPP